MAKNTDKQNDGPIEMTDEQAMDILMDVVDRAGKGEDVEKLEEEFVARLGL